MTPLPRRVLLFCHNQLTCDYVSRVGSLLSGDPRLELTMGVDTTFIGEDGARALRSSGGWHIQRDPGLSGWDLVVASDHNQMGWFAHYCPVVHIGHGLVAGKIIDGQVYRYAPEYILDGDRKPIYARQLVPSEQERRWGAESFPEIAPRLAVVGDLRVDELMALEPERAAIRRQLGFDDGEVVVAIISTWGCDSLLERMGAPLIAEAHRLIESGRTRFILLAHPNHWSLHGQCAEPWDARLNAWSRPGLVVRDPRDDWAPYLIASDMAVADQSTLTMTYALLGRPLVFPPPVPGTVAPGSATARLMDACPRLCEPGDLSTAIEAALERGPTEGHSRVAGEICDHIGSARERVSAELYRLLGLDPPS